VRTRLLKEIRPLLWPVWISILAIMVVASLGTSHADRQTWIITVVVIASSIIAALSFGLEFAQGTLPQLLTEPVPRQRIWFEKMLAMGLALIPYVALLLIFLACRRPDGQDAMYWAVAFVPVVALLGTPFLTLFGRSTIGAVVLSLAIPFLLYAACDALVLWGYRLELYQVQILEDQIVDAVLAQRTVRFFAIMLASCSAMACWLGYRRFQKLEVVDLFDRQIRLATPLHELFDRFLTRLFSTSPKFVRALFRKELRLQQSAMSLTVISGIVQIVVLIFIRTAHPKDPQTWLIAPLIIYAMLTPLLIGASAVAEETKLGVRGWQLTVPVSARSQWFIKVFSVVGLTILLAGIVPLMWSVVGNFVSASLPISFEPTALSTAGTLQVVAAIIAFYCSSFNRDTLRALLTATALIGGFASFAALVHHFFEKHPLFVPIVEFLSDRFLGFWSWQVFGVVSFVSVVVSVSIPVLLCSFHHFKRLDYSGRKVWTLIPIAFAPGLLVIFIILNVAFSATELRL
jgi:ABC-type transport system involved in multi-copper enzyme maturation permease subunit